MITNAEIRAEYEEDRRILIEAFHLDVDTFPSDIGELWPLLVFDAFLHLHCTYKRTEQYQRYRKWLEEMIVTGVRATEGER